MNKVLAFIRDNWQLVVIVVTILAATVGVKFTFERGPANSDPQIIVIIPDPDQPSVYGAAGAGLNRDFHPLIRVHLARAVMKRDGIGFGQAWIKCRKVTNEDIAGATIQAASETQTPVGKLGDGELLKKIIEWLQSPEGQAFIAALIKILLVLVAV